MRELFRTINNMDIGGTPAEIDEFKEFKKRVKKTILAMDATVRGELIRLNKHHKNTIKHNVMVAHDVEYIAKELKLPPKEQQALFIAALLHDIGKLDILDILLDSTK